MIDVFLLNSTKKEIYLKKKKKKRKERNNEAKVQFKDMYTIILQLIKKSTI